MSVITPLLLLLVPLLPLSLGMLAQGIPESIFPRLGRWLGWSVLLLSLFLAAALGFTGVPAEAPGLRADTLALALSLLVAFLGLSVIRFSRNYLRADPDQARYWRNLHLCLGATQALVLASNLVVLWISWVGVGLALHGLLTHFRDRGEARVAAWKKFVVGRVGDLCLLGSFLQLHGASGSIGLAELSAWASAKPEAVPVTACLLLVCSGLLKSAQFPFHSWLPGALETPGTVSALMHAGVVNAGGFLLLRLSPVLVTAPASLRVVALVGCVTALYGSVVLLAQPSVKRRLAYSTVAQMGFMMVEIGLGAFQLALLHLLAHSVYKAQAFLRAGGAVAAARPGLPKLGLGAGLWGVLGATLVVGLARYLTLGHAPALPFDVLLALGVAYLLAAGQAAGRVLGSVLYSVAGVLAARLLHFLSLGLFAFPAAPEGSSLLSLGIVLGFSLLLVLQFVLPSTASRPSLRAFHVHALNGFYVEALLRRLLHRVSGGRLISP